MKVLKGVLLESKQYYLDIKKRIEGKLLSLPKGSIKERNISGKKYCYLQQRIGSRVVHKYLGKVRPESLIRGLHERIVLKKQLREVNEALKMLRKVSGKS